MHLKFAILTAFGIVGAFPAPAIAQLTINSTGLVSGTIAPPNRNPTFNNRVTKVDTDAQGRYFRNGILVYQAPDLAWFRWMLRGDPMSISWGFPSSPPTVP